MIKTLLSFLLAAFYTVAFSQTTISFCASVDKDGNCIFNNTKFITSPDSSSQKIAMIVRNPNGVNTTKLTYRVYTVNKEGTETLIDSVWQDTERDWIYAWQAGNFKTPGKYRVKVVNDIGLDMVNKAFELFFVW